jgi:hypothetical protein
LELLFLAALPAASQRCKQLDSLALSENTALFSRFYAAAGVCSPTRAAYLTGRTNERDCIHFALNCDSENPAPGCSQGKGLPWSEFTTAKAAKKSKLGDYATIMLGKYLACSAFAFTRVIVWASLAQTLQLQPHMAIPQFRPNRLFRSLLPHVAPPMQL